MCRESFDFVSHIQTQRGLHLSFQCQGSVPPSPQAYLTQVQHDRHICTQQNEQIRGAELIRYENAELKPYTARWSRPVTDRAVGRRTLKWEQQIKRQERRTVYIDTFSPGSHLLSADTKMTSTQIKGGYYHLFTQWESLFFNSCAALVVRFTKCMKMRALTKVGWKVESTRR